LQTVPIVTMRIQSIKGLEAAEYARSIGLSPGYWALRREYRSTYRDTLVGTESLVAGAWFGAAPGPDGVSEVSLEQDVATSLRVGLGDEITWDVQGIPIRTRLTSLRVVEWGRFEPNFFAVFPSAALRGAPLQHVMIAAVSDETSVAQLQRAAVARYPNVSSVDLTLIRATIGQIVERVSTAVRFLALFSFAMGVPVLFSAVAATRRDRLRESVLLKALGASRAQVGRILLTEYAALGLLGALSGMLLSFAGAWALVTFVFKLSFAPAPLGALAIAALMAAMALAIGFLTSRDVFRVTAMEALRE